MSILSMTNMEEKWSSLVCMSPSGPSVARDTRGPAADWHKQVDIAHHWLFNHIYLKV